MLIVAAALLALLALAGLLWALAPSVPRAQKPDAIEDPAPPPPAATPTHPDSPPLVPVGGSSAQPSARLPTEGSLVALLGVPEAAEGSSPSGSPDLPRLAAAAASPFEGPSLDLGAPEPEGGAPATRPPRAWLPQGLRPATLGLLGGIVWWLATPTTQIEGLRPAAGAAGGLGLAALAVLTTRAWTREGRRRFEHELATALPSIAQDPAGTRRSPDAARDLLAGLRAAAPPHGPLRAELDRVEDSWASSMSRADLVASARARSGDAWARVLAGLDEAERSGAPVGPLLRHTAEALGSAGRAPARRAGLAAWLAALGLEAIAAAIVTGAIG